MKIDLIANDGSPIGVTPNDIYGKGVGGAELAMMSLMDVFAQRGHEVRVYNDAIRGGDFNGVDYRGRHTFNPREARDALIIFRSPNPLMIGALARRKIWWSMDQYTIGSYVSLAELVDYCVTISPRHTEYHKKVYRIEDSKIGHIDLGVKVEEYDREISQEGCAPCKNSGKININGRPEECPRCEGRGKLSKVEGRMIWCSIPDRGLRILHAAWPLIKRDVPQASLVITSDYTLWGASSNVSGHRLDWAGMEGVRFLGNIPREELVQHQIKAEIMPYPCVYEELFCISAAECQVAGALPVTSMAGALPTTNSFGITVQGDLTNPLTLQQNFVDRITSLMRHDRPYLEERRKTMRIGAKLRFDWNTIAETWEKLFEEGTL